MTNQQKSKAKKGADYFALRVSHDSSGGGGEEEEEEERLSFDLRPKRTEMTSQRRLKSKRRK